MVYIPGFEIWEWGLKIFDSRNYHINGSHAISPISFLSEVEGGGDSGDSSSGGDSSMSAAVGAITGAVCGLYGMYVVVGSASVLIIYWLLPLMTGKHVLLVQPITVKSPLQVVMLNRQWIVV